MNAKLCDFGWSIESFQKRETFCGTLEYMAPEIITNKKYTKSIDIWSLGILLYELYHNYSPFRSKKQEQVFKNILRKKIVFNDIDPSVKFLIESLLKINPD